VVNNFLTATTMKKKIFFLPLLAIAIAACDTSIEDSSVKFQVGTNIKPVENVTVSGAVQAAIPIYSDTPAKGTPVFGLAIPVAIKIAF